MRSALAPLVFVVAGCGVAAPVPPEVPADPITAALAHAAAAHCNVALLIVDPARGQGDRGAAAAFPFGMRRAVPVMIDLSSSRGRALAAPYHPSTTQPTLIGMDWSGLILSHTDGPHDIPDGFHEVNDYKGDHPETKLSTLSNEVAINRSSVAARMALADFLLAHTNDREAIPHLRFVADDASADLPTRVRAWVAMGRAHLWVGEPEKARHAAQALIDTLGAASPEAVAGGNLVRGLQDTRAKRYDRAHDELNAAVVAAPASPYGVEAAGLLTKLPTGGT